MPQGEVRRGEVSLTSPVVVFRPKVSSLSFALCMKDVFMNSDELLRRSFLVKLICGRSSEASSKRFEASREMLSKSDMKHCLIFISMETHCRKSDLNK